MTRDEAIKMLQATRLMLMDGANQPISDLYYALVMAIEALEQTDPSNSENPNNCEDEPTWEQVKEYCNKRCLDIVDSALRKKWYKDEPQTDNGIGCSRCEGRYDCCDRDMPHAVRCNNYGKVQTERSE